MFNLGSTPLRNSPLRPPDAAPAALRVLPCEHCVFFVHACMALPVIKSACVKPRPKKSKQIQRRVIREKRNDNRKAAHAVELVCTRNTRLFVTVYVLPPLAGHLKYAYTVLSVCGPGLMHPQVAYPLLM